MGEVLALTVPPTHPVIAATTIANKEDAFDTAHSGAMLNGDGNALSDRGEWPSLFAINPSVRPSVYPSIHLSIHGVVFIHILPETIEKRLGFYRYPNRDSQM